MMMFVMNQHKILFLRKLEDRGMKQHAFPGLYWSIKSCLHSNPEISDAEIKALRGTVLHNPLTIL